MRDAVVSDTACPRCGCHLVKHFECGCGKVHDDYCGNCGRFVSLAPDKHIELGLYDVRCETGPVQHEHSEEEKSQRLSAALKKLRDGKRKATT